MKCGKLDMTFLGLALILCLGFSSLAEAQALPKTYYGTYSHTPQGSTRAMGLGGANTGLSDDASGLIYNPAGVSFGSWIVDFDSTDNLTVNHEADIDEDGTADGIPYQFTFTAAALRLGPIAIAAGTSSPYFANIHGPNYNSTNAVLQIQSTNYVISTRVSDSLSIGVTYRQQSLFESYTSNYGHPMDANTTVAKDAYTVGLAYRPQKNKMGFGFTYTPETIFEVDTSLNRQIGFLDWQENGGWFRGAVLPEKTSFGGFFRASDRLMYIADLDYIMPPKNMVYVESPFDGEIHDNQSIKTFPVAIPHGGIEYQVLREKKRSVIWRVGGYREPARVVGAEDRFHMTMGVEVGLGPLTISAAMDETKNFTNSSQSFSLSFGE